MNTSAGVQHRRCSVCDNEVVVLTPEIRGIEAISCHDRPMMHAAHLSCATAGHGRFDGGLEAGRIYREDVSGASFRCVRSGSGAVTLAGQNFARCAR